MVTKKGTVNVSVDQYAGKSLSYKVLKTIFLVITWACIGLCTSIAGPTLVDLKLRTNSNYEDVAFGISGRIAGYLIGSALGGVLVDKLLPYCDLMTGISQVGMAVSSVLAPWCFHYMWLWFVFVLTGTFEGVINITGQKVIMDLWQVRAPSFLNALHGGYGVGSFIVPLIANPFLATLLQTDGAADNMSAANVTHQFDPSALATTFSPLDNITLTVGNQDSLTKHAQDSRIEYAYAISSSIATICSSVYFVYHFTDKQIRQVIRKQQKKNKTERLSFLNIVNPATCASGNLFHGLQLFIILFMFYFNAIAVECVSGNFIRVFSIDQLGFSKDEGSYINTAFWISFALGRLSGFIVARFIPIRILIILEISGVMLTTIFLTIFGHTNAMALWVLTQPLAFFIAPVFPSAMGWANYHMTMTGFGITTLLVGYSVGCICYLRLVGYLYDLYGPRSFQFTVLAAASFSSILVVLMHVTGSRHGARFTKNDSVEKVDEDQKES